MLLPGIFVSLNAQGSFFSFTCSMSPSDCLQRLTEGASSMASILLLSVFPVECESSLSERESHKRI